MFELEPSASAQHWPSESETDKVEAKSQGQRTGLESSGDDFEEFVGVLDRIHYMKTRHADWDFSNSKSMSAEDLGVKVLKTKSPWIPSFEWEDFCKCGGKHTTPAQKDIYNLQRKENGSSSCEEKGKQSIQPANHFATPSFSRDAYDNRPAETFDLNVEASL